MVQIQFIDRALTPPPRPYDWLFITSKWTVRAIVAAGLQPAQLAKRTAVIGPGTHAECTKAGFNTHFECKGNTLKSLVHELNLSSKQRILYPRSALSDLASFTQSLPNNTTLEAPVAYRNVMPSQAPVELLQTLPVDLVVACSSSAAERLGQIHSSRSVEQDFDLLTIGPSTAATCERMNLRVTEIATPHSVNGLLRALHNRANGVLPPPY